MKERLHRSTLIFLVKGRVPVLLSRLSIEDFFEAMTFSYIVVFSKKRAGILRFTC